MATMELASMELRRLWLTKRLEKDLERLEKARHRLPKLWRDLLRELWSLHRTFSVLKTRYLLRREAMRELEDRARRS